MPSPSTRSVSRSKGIRSRSCPACCPAAAWDTSVGNGASQIAFSSNGTVVYIAGSALGAYSRLGIVDRSGTPLFTYPEKGEFGDPRFSPDGARIALQMGDGKTSQLYVLNVDRQQMTKVTFDGTYNGLPVWSPDGQQLAYFSDRVSGGVNVFLRRSDGAGEPEALTTGDGIKVPTSFSQDGRHLLVMQAEQGSAAGNFGAASYDVAVLSLADRQLTPFAATPASELLPAFSPDGRWVAYQSVESGMVNVYVRPYPGPGGRWQISAGGGAQPYWTKGGRELVYLAVPTGFAGSDGPDHGGRNCRRGGRAQAGQAASALRDAPRASSALKVLRRLFRRQPIRGAEG